MKNGTYETVDGIEICIPLPPVTKKNSQRIGKRYVGGKLVPFVLPSEKYEQYERDCGFFLRPVEIDYPVNVQAIFYMPTRRRVDLTNLNEALHDVLVACGVLADDNSRIIISTDGSRVRYDKNNPRTEVVITRAEEEDV